MNVEGTAIALVVGTGLIFALWTLFGWGVGVGVLLVIIILGAAAASRDREARDEHRRKVREAAWRFGDRDLR